MPIPFSRHEALQRRLMAPGRAGAMGAVWLQAVRASAPARRAIALASVCLLLLAQLLLATHVHVGTRAPADGDDGGAVCSICLFQAAGHEQLGPVGQAGDVALPLDPGLAAPAAPGPVASPQGWRYRKQARGPPAGLRLA